MCPYFSMWPNVKLTTFKMSVTTVAGMHSFIADINCEKYKFLMQVQYLTFILLYR